MAVQVLPQPPHLYLLFTPVNGGTGASATPTVNVDTPATFTVAFNRTYTYTWNVPDIPINDLAKLSAINIIATGFSSTSPYTYRILGLQYNSSDSFFAIMEHLFYQRHKIQMYVLIVH
jgi:hypothetical protein